MFGNEPIMQSSVNGLAICGNELTEQNEDCDRNVCDKECESKCDVNRCRLVTDKLSECKGRCC